MCMNLFQLQRRSTTLNVLPVILKPQTQAFLNCFVKLSKQIINTINAIRYGKYAFMRMKYVH